MRTSQPEKYLARLRLELLPRIQVISYNVAAAEAYGILRAHLEKEGQTLAHPDLLIASIALAGGLTLITGNVRHFARIPGLEVEDWIRDRSPTRH